MRVGFVRNRQSEGQSSYESIFKLEIIIVQVGEKEKQYEAMEFDSEDEMEQFQVNVHIVSLCNGSLLNMISTGNRGRLHATQKKEGYKRRCHLRHVGRA